MEQAQTWIYNGICKKNNLKVIEDAAQAVGVRYKGEHSGNKGHVSVFSFFADKTVTMGEEAYYN